MTEKDKFISGLYEANASDLLQYAYHLTGDWQLAEDLAHRTFCVLMIKADEVLTHPTPVKWLYITLHNIYYNEALKYFRSEILTDDENMLSPRFGQEPENKDSLLEILPAELSKEDKQILQWYFGDQLSYGKIAMRLEINEAAARKRVSRAVRQCGKFFEKN